MTDANSETRRQAAIIYDEFSALLSQWPESFAVDVDCTDFEETGHFEVTVTHRHLGVSHYVCARLGDADLAEISLGEEYWEFLDQGSLFAYFWFDLVYKVRDSL